VGGSITPSSGRPGATPLATGASWRRGGEDDRSPGRGQDHGGILVEVDQPTGGPHVRDQHRERLVVACLAPSQLGDRRLVPASTARW
jgi:hypothetical protein